VAGGERYARLLLSDNKEKLNTKTGWDRDTRCVAYEFYLLLNWSTIELISIFQQSLLQWVFVHEDATWTKKDSPLANGALHTVSLELQPLGKPLVDVREDVDTSGQVPRVVEFVCGRD
jgi:hypothetical protein